jgi:hypothetical protein
MTSDDTDPRRWHTTRIFPAVFLLPLAFLPTSVCEAQIVVGHLFEAGSALPVEGALVVLVRESGEEEDGYLTNSAGLFRLRAGSAGQFRLRTERIGYGTVFSPPFELTSGQVLGMDLETAFAPITLEGIDVEGEQRCVVRPEEGLVLARLWEEARKALRVQDWTERKGLYEYQVSDYERELGPEGRLVQTETRETHTRVARVPYRSLPVEDLLTHGFIQRLEDGSFDFFAPDASVLLSDPFLDTHCFRLTEDRQAPGSIGLSFEPIEERGLSDIEGTLWLERESAKLRSLQYWYTDLPYPGAAAPAGGRVEFQGLPDGAWIVRRWWILMPTVSPYWTVGPRRRVEYKVTSFKEAGGEVREVYSADQLVLREVPQVILTGVVWDSTQGQPLSGAEVYLSGTSHEAVTDSAGRFSMMELPEGVYTAAFSHPLLDSLGLFPPGREVEITLDQVTDIELAVPSMETLLATLCEPDEENLQTFALVGKVLLGGSERPIPRATVTIEWTRLVERSRVDIRSDFTITEIKDHGFDQTMTDMDGRYVFCGLPPKTDIEVFPSFMEQVGDTTTVQGEADSHTVLNLELHFPPGTLSYRTSAEGLSPPREEQGIQGRVVDPVTGNPVPNAEVTITWSQGEFTRTETANSQGLFRILSPWLGTFTLQATALGYKPVRSDSLELEPGKLTVVDIEMPAEPIDLEPLVIVAEPRVFQLDVNGFYDRAGQGFGHFITPEKIEARQLVEVSDLLRDIPGLTVERTVFGTRVVMPKPGLHGDFCEPRLYVDGILISQPRPANHPESMGIYPDQAVSVSEIAGMEVYTRSTGLPLAYGGTQGSCGAILIWTKVG